MKQIGAFIDSIYKNAGSSKEEKELKEEMRNHLVEAVQELIKEGKFLFLIRLVLNYQFSLTEQKDLI